MKKFVIFGLSVLLTAVCACLISACSDKGIAPDRPLHIWSEEWSSDSKSHWHACTDNGCPGKDGNEYHIFELVKTSQKPTCTKDGFGTWKCSVCGYTKEDAIEKTPHNFELTETTKMPTCYQPGSGIFACSVCGYSEEQLIDATGDHIFTDSKFDHDDNCHWHVCTATYGCTAIDEHVPHVEGEAEIIQPDSVMWTDGSETYYCSVCGTFMREIPIYHRKAPASFDFNLAYGGERVEMTPMEQENGFDCYSLTLVKGRAYTVIIENAINNYGEPIEITSEDIPWDVPTLHGMKAFYLDDMGREVECSTSTLSKDSRVIFTSTLTCNTLAPSNNTLKIIIRFETGVNDYNYHNRRIRVTKILYVTCVQDSQTASLLQKAAIPPMPEIVSGNYAATENEINKRRSF